jgi:hypothetical protein
VVFCEQGNERSDSKKVGSFLEHETTTSFSIDFSSNLNTDNGKWAGAGLFN